MNSVTEWPLERDLLELKDLLLPWEHLRNKRVFLTGATGFIGGYLARALCWLDHQLSLGLKICLFHRVHKEPAFSAACVHWVSGDITKEFIPGGFHPDIIIHAASPANQRAIHADPIGVVSCNVLATRYLLECARENHSTLVFFGTGMVYQQRTGRIPEKSAEDLAQNNLLPLYSGSKLAGELLCEQYHCKYGINYRTLRLFSIFGPGESLTSGRCFTDFIGQALKTHTVQINGSGTQLRSFCYLSDFVSGLLHVLLNGESGIYNIGNEDNTCSILELARQIAKIAENTDVIGPLSADNREDSFVPDTTKLRQLGWQPQVNLQDCIKRCMDSYR